MSIHRNRKGSILAGWRSSLAQVFFPFHREQVFLAAVAGLAGEYDIAAGRTATADEGYDVVKGRLVARNGFLTVETDGSIHLPLPPPRLLQGTSLSLLLLKRFRTDFRNKGCQLVAKLGFLGATL